LFSAAQGAGADVGVEAGDGSVPANDILKITATSIRLIAERKRLLISESPSEGRGARKC
jgi:hypothetical protein